ncbi:hypothetical protein [Virgibacillus oceani]|uniref:Uncharacterized protein n=1 Tax=Virgibacillus oceani TaxID=1479511 RepID=A0A917H4T5_9BACI|nr:hypothetical protein [Virgibacillus oceani]GGG67425.1 hypothetical protein GCM10011398_08970 [Virgibacillus oceani]
MPRKVAVLTEQSTAGDKGNSGERKRIDVDLIVRQESVSSSRLMRWSWTWPM